jgi:hypothetical protein
VSHLDIPRWQDRVHRVGTRLGRRPQSRGAGGLGRPQANVDVVKRVLDAFNRSAVDAFLDLATPDFEWFPVMILAVEGESYRGGEG